MIPKLPSRQVFTLALLSAMLTALSGCYALAFIGNKAIHYIVPDGYRGRFVIALDTRDGQEIEVRNGRYIFKIPPNGVLKVKSFNPLFGSHEVSAAYESGAKLLTDGSDVTNDDIALRSGSNTDTELRYVVGTVEDLRKELSEMETGAMSTPENVPPNP